MMKKKSLFMSYESKDDDDGIIDVGNWGDRQDHLKSTGDDEDKDDDDNDGTEYDVNAEVGDEEDGEAELGGKDNDDKRSMNGFQELFENEADAAGMTSRKKRRRGGQTQ